MTPLFKKLNLGEHATVHVLGAPASFEKELRALKGVEIKRSATGAVGFALAFVKTLAEVQRATTALIRRAEGDVILWMIYPKGTSRKYQCDFNRDTGWAALGEAGYEPVRQVAVDEDWSALRFRRVEFIKTLTRNPDGALTVAGRQKARASRS